MSSELTLLRTELDRFAATGVQRQKFEEDVPKARAAIAKAVSVDAKQPIAYALSIFNSASFSAPKAAPATNLSAVVNCQTCNGDRMVVFSTRPAVASGWMLEREIKAQGDVEEYAPCPDCNSNANTVRPGYASPSQDRVRERLSRQ